VATSFEIGPSFLKCVDIVIRKLDWEQDVFREELAGRSLFGNVHIAETSTARWRAVREAKDDFTKAETLGK
jgi:hypothetical protein